MKFRKKPVIVDAVQFTSGLEDGYACYVEEGGRFLGYHDKNTFLPQWVRKVPAIKTLEGFHEISAGDWIISGILGERYPCEPEIFAQTYEAAEGPPHEDEAHDSIREAYRNAKRAHGRYDVGFYNGVEYALEALGVKITEVNA